MNGEASIEVELGSYVADQENVLVWKHNRTLTTWTDAKVNLKGFINSSVIIIKAVSNFRNRVFYVGLDSINIINGTCPFGKSLCWLKLMSG